MEELRDLCLASRQPSAGSGASGSLRSVLGDHPARRYPRDQASERPLSLRQSGDDHHQQGGRRSHRQLTGGSAPYAQPAADGCAGSSEVSRPDPAWFRPRNIERLGQRIRSIARASVGRMAAKGSECDFVREVALHYPPRVVVGTPEEYEPRMLMLTQELFGAMDPELIRFPAAIGSGETRPTCLCQARPLTRANLHRECHSLGHPGNELHAIGHRRHASRRPGHRQGLVLISTKRGDSPKAPRLGF